MNGILFCLSLQTIVIFFVFLVCFYSCIIREWFHCIVSLYLRQTIGNFT